MTEETGTVHLIDDDPSVRRAVARLLKSAGFVCEPWPSAEQFLRHAVVNGPVCIVLDVRLPELSGLDLQQILEATGRPLPIVFITGHGDIPMSVRAIKAGAVDFLTKPFAEAELLAAVRQAIAASRLATEAAASVDDLFRRAAALSPREREVMELIVSGLLNKQAGHRLGITEKTVKAHRAQVMRKMAARSLPDLVRMVDTLRRSQRRPTRGPS